MAEILTHHAADKAYRQEYGDNRAADGHHRQTDGVRSVNRRLKRAFAHVQVLLDIFNFHNRIVHQNADDQHNRQQGDAVERVAQQLHDEKGGQHGEGQSKRGHQRGTPVAQKQHHHQHREQCAFQQRVHGNAVIFARVFHRIVDDGDFDIGVFRRQFRYRLFHAFGHHCVARTFAAQYVEADDFFAVQTGTVANLLAAVAHGGQFGQFDKPSAAQRNWRVGKLLQGLCAVQHADGLFLRVGNGAAGGNVGVGLRQLRVYLFGGDAQRVQAFGFQGDVDFAFRTADACNLLHAAHGQQFAAHRVVNKP